MKFENKSTSKIIKFLNGRAFYVVLCLCFVAVGVAAWSGLEGMRRLDSLENTSGQSKVQNSSKVEILQVTPPDITSDKTDIGENVTHSEVAKPSEPETEEAAAPVAKFFVNPVLGAVTKDFSDTELQYSMTMCDMRLHKAVDLAADEGTSVVAAGEGTVIDVYTDAMLGSVVEIDHGNGITAKYCGLNDEPFIKKGDTVDSSKRIGTVGIIPSESVERRHIHIEFYKNGKAVSPMNYIPK